MDRLGCGVLVIGSLTVDLTSVSEGLPAPGETVLGTGFTRVAGGKGGNQAIASARMGASTWMLGRVGEDDLSKVVLDTLDMAHVSTTLIESTPGAQTGIAHIRVDAAGENNIVMVPLANATLEPRNVDEAMDAVHGRVNVLLTQFEIPVETAVYALASGRAAGMITVLDPAPVPRDGIPAKTYRDVDFITPNENEASLLTGVRVCDPQSAVVAGRILVDRGCGAAVVTLGSQGVVIVDSEGRAQHSESHRVEVIDSTAAGDAFAGALGSRLAVGDTVWEAVAWANAAGGLAATVMGASSSIPIFSAVAVERSRTTNERRLM